MDLTDVAAELLASRPPPVPATAERRPAPVDDVVHGVPQRRPFVRVVAAYAWLVSLFLLLVTRASLKAAVAVLGRVLGHARTSLDASWARAEERARARFPELRAASRRRGD